ncbi:hypothetical protein AAHA92_00994 [Salvia divinorum]|uniref:Uncharacterized protein n=1 Tax=Salvia divinorum TaxID=28513 RepID=A0ABD1INQ7_SALDI
MKDDYYPMNSFEKNLETQDSNGLGSGSGAKGDRTRRSCDNGFRSGYLTRAAEVLKKEFPNSGIKSGVGFNMNGDYKIDCDDDQWSQIVKCDPNARFMRYKSWPLWEDWKYLFGKDHASGAVAEDTYDGCDGVAEQTQSQLHDEGLKFPLEAEEFSATNPNPGQGPVATPDESTG